VRFLHLLMREVGEGIANCRLPIAECGHFRIENSDLHFALVPALSVNGRLIQAWQEAVERDVHTPGINLYETDEQPYLKTFSFPASETVEALIDDGKGETVAVIVRKQQPINGTIEIQLDALSLKSSDNRINRQSAIGNRQSKRLTVRILNQTQLTDADRRTRDEALIESVREGLGLPANAAMKPPSRCRPCRSRARDFAVPSRPAASCCPAT